MARDKSEENILDLFSRILENQSNSKEFIESQRKLPKLNIDDFELRKSPDLDHVELFDPKAGKTAGNFQWITEHITDPTTQEIFEIPAFGEHTFKESWDRRIPLKDYIKMDYPELEPEYRARGLGQQMYKKIEEITGKKIIPDTSLTKSSLSLHEKKGLGKSFGEEKYKTGIIKNILESIGDTPANRALAKKLYENRVEEMKKIGLKNFKSIAPMLAKGAAAGLGGAISLGAEASDADPLGTGEGEELRKMKHEERMKRDPMYKSGSEYMEANPFRAQDLLTEEKGPKLKKLSKLLGK